MRRRNDGAEVEIGGIIRSTSTSSPGGRGYRDRRSKAGGKRRRQRQEDSGSSTGADSSEVIGAIVVFVATLVIIGVFYGNSSGANVNDANRVSSLDRGSSSNNSNGRLRSRAAVRRRHRLNTKPATASLPIGAETDTAADNSNFNQQQSTQLSSQHTQCTILYRPRIPILNILHVGNSNVGRTDMDAGKTLSALGICQSDFCCGVYQSNNAKRNI